MVTEGVPVISFLVLINKVTIGPFIWVSRLFLSIAMARWKMQDSCQSSSQSGMLECACWLLTPGNLLSCLAFSARLTFWNMCVPVPMEWAPREIRPLENPLFGHVMSQKMGCWVSLVCSLAWVWCSCHECLTTGLIYTVCQPILKQLMSSEDFSAIFGSLRMVNEDRKWQCQETWHRRLRQIDQNHETCGPHEVWLPILNCIIPTKTSL